jgi:hypothetical protein
VGRAARIAVRDFVAILAIVVAVMAVIAASATADTGDIIEGPANGQPESPSNGWQAGVCTTDSPQCSVETPSQFYTPAAGHPGIGFTQFIVKHTNGLLGTQYPAGKVKDIRVDLPVGLSVNPSATPQCELATFEAGSCPANTIVGTSALTLSAAGIVLQPIENLTRIPVYNLVPEDGHPALFGFTAAGQHVYLKADIEWAGDYHEGFTIAVPEPPLGELLKNRLTFNGRAGDGTFLTNPSTCLDPAAPGNQGIYSTMLRADSVAQPNPSFPAGSSFFESPLPTGVKPTGCASVPFDPSVTVEGNGVATDSPAGPTVTLSVPFKREAEAINDSTVRDASVALPVGTGLNPAAAPKLGFCSDEQFGKGTTRPIACPANSRIGAAAIEAPQLPVPLTGSVYLGTQLNREPESGGEYRVFLDAASSRYGVDVRLVGNVVANKTTGALVAVFKELPQVSFTAVKITFDPGLGALSSPPICTSSAASTVTPYSGTAPRSPVGTLTLTQAPGGGPCAKSMGERPFAPSVAAASASAKAGAATPFALQIGRTDGQQELKGFDLTLPPGATAKIAGVPYCEPSEFERANGMSGIEEQKGWSCPGRSEIGVATVLAGTGSTPLKIEGKAFLSGPYMGAPLSAVVITPAVAGPFDLGNVVVRAPIDLNPETGQIETSADLPDVFGGAKLDIRSIQINLNAKEFTLNGTNCNQNATVGQIAGGGSDPTNSSAWSHVNVSVPFQNQGCDALDFSPHLKLRLFGQTRRAGHPKLQATLTTTEGQANLASASVALPRAIFLDQASLGTVCTRPQFAAGQCPAKSVYGFARAWSPLVAKPLEGPVYLRSSNNTLPDMVADLKGQVDIVLDGRIDSFKGGIRTTFGGIPDLPVSKFEITVPGGKHGLLQASTNLCKKPVKGIIGLVGQNGKQVNSNVRIQRTCKRKPGKHRKHGAKKHAKGKKHPKGKKPGKGKKHAKG